MVTPPRVEPPGLFLDRDRYASRQRDRVSEIVLGPELEAEAGPGLHAGRRFVHDPQPGGGPGDHGDGVGVPRSQIAAGACKTGPGRVQHHAAEGRDAAGQDGGDGPLIVAPVGPVSIVNATVPATAVSSVPRYVSAVTVEREADYRR